MSLLLLALVVLVALLYAGLPVAAFWLLTAVVSVWAGVRAANARP